jgi:hypothetical protein
VLPEPDRARWSVWFGRPVRTICGRWSLPTSDLDDDLPLCADCAKVVDLILAVD